MIRKTDGDEISAETRVIGNFGITFPTPNFFLRFASNRSQIFRWNDDPNASFYDLSMRIHYTEAPQNNPSDTTSKFLDWSIAKNLKPDNSQFGLVTYELEDGARFYQFLQNNLDVNPSIQRRLSRIDVIVYAGGEELLKYIEAGLANSGITSAETLPLYSNIDGGLGLFSTRYAEQTRGFLPNQAMLDTLSSGPYTNQLGF